ncbi:hypothetical protein N656DRAFT_448545 [Canariomyces notabilis]|uniref:B30.2/SPRY domain-containing protein n=1 Tax=Canariomyces notabilis TaxID=2074819 RepID=A0AAN6T7P4_9PEZI|nr:hypothetical protein N656DRAFT_448545 [Canariomyces arenarius]
MADHPIPLGELYYFEVKIIKDSESREVGIGFCRKNYYNRWFPGWGPGSWGYHGDDGNFFVEQVPGYPPSADFGPSGEYGENDVVGCGFNAQKGFGFVVRNGKRLEFDSGCLRRDSLMKGKMYPCIGMKVDAYGIGLVIEVNFIGPYLYKLPDDLDCQ